MTHSTPKLHVVMLIDSWFPHRLRQAGVMGGSQVHVRELRRLLTHHHDCRIELFYSSRPNLLTQTIWPLVTAYKLLRYARHHDIDLIHTHGYSSALTAKLVSLILKKPVIHTVHGSNLLDLKKKTPQAWIENVILTKIKYAAQIAVTSNFLNHKNVNQNIFVIPNGVNTREFDEVIVPKNQEPTLIWVGREDKVKGLEYLKKAIIKIRKEFPTLKTELVTGGRLTGKALIKAYKRAHVFVLPSLAEGQPITLLEAWAAQLPVVVTNVGENKRMVVDGVNGYLVDPGNVSQLAHAIIRVLRARIKNKRMGVIGYELVKTNYSWNRTAAETYLAYQQVLLAAGQPAFEPLHSP